METVAFHHLLILGLAIVGGLLGAGLFRKIRCPQVIGYIVIGLIVGESGLHLIRTEEILSLESFNLFALGIIGLLVGGELKIESFKRYGKQFAAILLGEGLAAFLIVGLGVGLLIYHLFHNGAAALATGIVFGAIASATDPASTVSVLWETRSLGVLTTSLTAIVALDDALAMTLYGLGTGIAQVVTSQGGNVLAGLLAVWGELLGAVLLGVISGFLLEVVLRRVNDPQQSLAYAIGLILLVIGTAVFAHLDVILASMSMGFVVGNRLPRRSEEMFKVARGFSIPIYALFFVMVGARLSFGSMPWWLWVIVGIYVVGRNGGKMLGAALGARWTGSPDAVRRYLGLGLFAQGGVAIGLSIMASQRLNGIAVTETLSLGDVIIFGVAATTFIVQLIGPPMVKWAVTLADEAGRNVTKEDIVARWRARDVMSDDVEFVRDDEPLARVVQRFTEQDHAFYPVVDDQQNLVGGISLNMLKDILADQATWQWLVASDVMRSIHHKVTPDTPLSTVIDLMEDRQIHHLTVVSDTPQERPVGIISSAELQTRLQRELVRCRHRAHETRAAKSDLPKAAPAAT